jgi:hypothetical protein
MSVAKIAITMDRGLVEQVDRLVREQEGLEIRFIDAVRSAAVLQR